MIEWPPRRQSINSTASSVVFPCVQFPSCPLHGIGPSSRCVTTTCSSTIDRPKRLNISIRQGGNSAARLINLSISGHSVAAGSPFFFRMHKTLSLCSVRQRHYRPLRRYRQLKRQRSRNECAKLDIGAGLRMSRFREFSVPTNPALTQHVH